MATFRYRAMNASGLIVRDEVIAADRDALGAHLRLLGLDLLSCREVNGDLRRFSWGYLSRPPETWALLQSLAFLMASGLPILTSLDLLAQQWQTQPAAVRLVSRWQRSIMSGSTFSDALKDSGARLDTISMALILAGEQSGSLIPAIESGADEFFRAQAMRKQLIKAMAYPLMTFVTLLVAMSVMIYAVLPLLIGLARSQRLALPWYTEWLGRFSFALHQITWQFLCVIGASLCVIVVVVGCVPAVRRRVVQWRFRWPIVGSYCVLSDLSRCLRSLDLLYRSGIPLADALPLCQSSLLSKRLIDQWQSVTDSIHKGFGFHRAIVTYLALPAHYQRLLAIAEESGQLEYGLAQVVKLLDQTLDAKRAKWLSQLQPILLCLIGILMYWVISTVTDLMYGQMGALLP